MTEANLRAGSGQILKTIVDAKGDLIVGTAADTVGRLAVGTNDYVLTAASGEATGLKWAAAGGNMATDALWDAKGDLAGGTGANTAARLAVGANNTVLMADSGETTGLKWSASPIAVDTVWDAKGDLVVGTASNTAARLAVGAANTFPMADAGETTGLKYAVAPYHVCQGRITLTSATPVTTADVTGATTIYFTPYQGNSIGLFDGTYWDILSFSELSLALTDYTASKPYDIWVYNNSGTAALESTIWTSTTARATALTTQDGILVKTGATTRRYVGTIYINSSGGQTDDAYNKRHVYNYYNRQDRSIYKAQVDAHTYNSTTPRYWNNDSTSIISFIVGVVEDDITIGFGALAKASSVDSGALLWVALNWSSGTPAEPSPRQWNYTVSYIDTRANVTVVPQLGYQYYAAVEQLSFGTAALSAQELVITGNVRG